MAGILSCFAFVLFIMGIYFIVKGMDLGFLAMGSAFAVSILFGNRWMKGIRCPQCQNKIFPKFEGMEDARGEWVQLQFPCEKCNILWDTEEIENYNEK